MPTKDNPYAIDPQFTEAITPQQYVSTASTPPQSGTKGQNRAGAIATIADKFLAGVSRGQAIAFQRQQQERSNLMQDVNRGYDAIEKSDLTDQAKAEARGKLNALHVLAVKQSVDQSENKGNPMVKGLKNIFEGIVGPGAKKYEFGPEQIYKTLNDVNKITTDPKNTRAGVAEQATQAMDAASAPLFKAAVAAKEKDPNAPGVTTQQLLNNQDWVKGASNLQKLGIDIKKTPAWLSAEEEDKKQAGIAERKITADAKPKAKYIQEREDAESAYIEAHPDAKGKELSATQVAEGKRLLGAVSNPKAQGIVYGKVKGGSDKFVQLFYDKTKPNGYTTADGKRVSADQVEDVGGAPTRERLYGRMQLFYHIGKSKGMTDDDALNFAGNLAAQYENVELSGLQQRQLIAESKNFIGSGPGFNWAAIEKANPGADRASFEAGTQLTPDQLKAAEAEAEKTGGRPAPNKPGENPSKPLGPPATKLNTATVAQTQRGAIPPIKTVTTQQGDWPAGRDDKPVAGWKDPAGKFHSETPEDRRDYNAVLAASGAKGVGVKLPPKLQAAAQEKIEQRFGVTPEELASRVNFKNQATKDFDTNKSLVDATESFDKRLGRAIDILKNVNNLSPTDYQKVNEWIQSGYKQLDLDGQSPAFAQYVQAVQAVRNEYSRIISGGVRSNAQTPVAATQHAEELLASGFSKKTMDAAISMMKQEVQQNVSGIRENLKDLYNQSKADILPERKGGKWQGEPEPAPPPGQQTATPPGSNGKSGQPPPAQALPKPSKPGEHASDSIIDQYREAGKTHLDMIKDGWK